MYRYHGIGIEYAVTRLETFKNISKCYATLLVHFDRKREVVSSNDASKFGLGAVLLRRDNSGNENPIQHASKTSSVSE